MASLAQSHFPGLNKTCKSTQNLLKFSDFLLKMTENNPQIDKIAAFIPTYINFSIMYDVMRKTKTGNK